MLNKKKLLRKGVESVDKLGSSLFDKNLFPY